MLTIFTMPCYVSTVYAIIMCMCVCPSHAGIYCIKTLSYHIITQTIPHNSPRTLAFLCQIYLLNSNGVPLMGAPNAGGVS